MILIERALIIKDIYMKISFLLLLLVSLSGCAHKNGGFYNRDNKDTYTIQVGGAVPNPKYSFQRGVYEICKKNHGEGGHELLKNDQKSGDMGASWIEGRFKCTEKKDKYLDDKFQNDDHSFKELESPVNEFEKKYEIE